MIGKDEAGEKIKDLVTQNGSSSSQLITSPKRPSIIKTRYVGQNQQLLRVDDEPDGCIDKEWQEKVFDKVVKELPKNDVMILSDYGKGFLPHELIRKLIALAHKNKVPVIVDPKSKDFSLYKNATLVTPNRKELQAASNGASVKTDKDIEITAKQVLKYSGIQNLMVTRSEDGISVIPAKGKAVHYPTKVAEVYDVSGAGDTVVAVAAASIAAGGTYAQAAFLANKAGSIVVSKIGTATVSSEELSLGLDEERSGATHVDAAAVKIKQWQDAGLKVGFTNGCFDILHHGHVSYLAEAAKLCDKLVLGLNHDKSVKILKGSTRPINDEAARASVMSALSSIDMVVYFGATKKGEDNTPTNILSVLKPDILFKGGDYKITDLPEAKVVLANGGEVNIMPLYKGYSTTNIIEKSKKNA